mmetsp:Transcript_5512/g.8767  ORF Transcript_5512/g.8767 Transcript_5512/m.8767 type:complete len:223 (+) Transcript_5512:50-718(+)
MAVTGGLKPRKKGRSRAKLSDKRRKSLSSKDQIEQLCLWKTLAGDERDLVIERLEKELKPLLENKRVRSRVRFGFNEVSRSLERQEAQIVIWCRDVKPRALGEHLAAIAAVAAATAAADGHQDVSHAPPLAKRHPSLGRLALRDGGARLGRPFGLRRLAALALLRSMCSRAIFSPGAPFPVMDAQQMKTTSTVLRALTHVRTEGFSFFCSSTTDIWLIACLA